MKIQDANSLEYKNTILDLIAEIPKLDSTKDQLDVWLNLNLGTDIFGAWLAIDEQDEPVGVLTCEVIDQDIEPKVYISAWHPQALELLEQCEEWTSSKSIKKLVYYTKSTKRLLGFKPERVVMVKELSK